ncbi:PREDICTED: poly(U)-specific endoribonuclease-D-like [Nanorana parkeri]|uniref:poly(U)-specific endoribonuclease-D-like n=1 Tax=Nanorana parkeri TaxID=125878 RepID=UPI000854F1B2|nr:PREDICTED: poly(U)-specific endoribonuclease-D-like [Nanorana parkeri]
MKDAFVLLCIFPSVICGTTLPQLTGQPHLTSQFVVTNDEIQTLAEELYVADVNKAGSGDIRLNLQYKANSTQIRSRTDFASQKLFSYVNESKLFTIPTFTHLIALLDNYIKNTGTVESVTSRETQEQTDFIEAIFQTSVMSKLSKFFIDKGYYNSSESFANDLREMWFGLYTRRNRSLDSSGFEHVFHGEIHKRKISGFHSWVQLYLLEKAGEINYLSYSADGPWTSYPDVYSFQFKWSTYVKSLGSFFVGSSPEFDIAMYTLCYVTRPNRMCTVRFNGHSARIQTYSWANSYYRNGKRYLASSYPAL